MIKVTELMINDWVKLNGSNYQVQVIKKKGVIKLYENTKYGEHEIELNTDWVEEFIEPIPLTTEILEKNKFPYAPKADGYFVGDLFLKGNDDIGYSVGANIRIDNGYGIVSGIYYTFAKICYVHELQHVLKLCKIEKKLVL